MRIDLPASNGATAAFTGTDGALSSPTFLLRETVGGGLLTLAIALTPTLSRRERGIATPCPTHPRSG